MSEPRILAGRDWSLRFLRPDVTLRAEGRAELQEITHGAVLPRDDAGWFWGGTPLSAPQAARGTRVKPSRPSTATGKCLEWELMEHQESL